MFLTSFYPFFFSYFYLALSKIQTSTNSSYWRHSTSTCNGLKRLLEIKATPISSCREAILWARVIKVSLTAANDTSLHQTTVTSKQTWS